MDTVVPLEQLRLISLNKEEVTTKVFEVSVASAYDDSCSTS